MKPFAILTLLLLIGCAAPVPLPDSLLEDAPRGTTLYVFSPSRYSGVLRQAAREKGGTTEFELHLTTYTEAERESALPRLQTALMAGASYDMFIWDGFPTVNQLDSGIFTDINQLIPDREAFYSNILDAWEINGKLYIFPMSVDLTFINISAALPQSIIDRFTQHRTITTPKLMSIYLDLHHNYPEFSHMAYMTGYAPADPFRLHHVMNSFINFNTRTVSLNNPQFIEYLQNKQQIAGIEPTPTPWELNDDYWFFTLANNFVFQSLSGVGMNQLGAFVSLPEPAFIHSIPLADPHGNLIIEQSPGNASFPFWGSVSLTTAGDRRLSWDFIQYLQSAMVRHDMMDAMRDGTSPDYTWRFGVHNFMTPIRRDYFVPHIQRTLNRTFEEPLTASIWLRTVHGIPVIPTERAQVFADMMVQMDAFNQSEAAVMWYLPAGLYRDVIDEVLLGTMMAQQAAEIINNRVALWLIE